MILHASLLVIQSKDQVRVNKIKTEPHQLNNLQLSGNLRGILVRRAESEREILRHGRVLAVLLLLRRDEDLQLAGGQQLHPQGQPQLPHHPHGRPEGEGDLQEQSRWSS